MRVAPVLILVIVAGSVSLGSRAVLAQQRESCTFGVGATYTDLPIPSLAPPPGVTAFRPGLGGDSAGFRCSLRYDSPLATAAIAGHVRAQMTTMGWKPGGTGGDSTLAVAHFTGTATGGDPLTAATLVTALDGTSYHDVSLHISRIEVAADSRATPPGRGGRSGGGGAGISAGTVPAVFLKGLLNTGLPVAPPGSYTERDSLPSAFPKELLPAGTEFRLAVTSTTHTAVVGVARAFTLFEIPPHLVALTKSGWTGRPPARGFSFSILRPVDLCRGAELATVEFLTLDSGGFAVRASHTRGSTVPCDAGFPRGGGTFIDVAVPFLMPLGVTATSASVAGGVDAQDSFLRTQTSVEPAALVSELATQLTRGGWTIVAQPVAGDIRVIRARNASAAGDPVTALVTLIPLGGPTRVSLWLHVVRHKPVAPPRGGS